MAQKITIFIIIFLLVVLQVSFLPNFFPPQAVPDLLLVMLIFWVARRGLEKTWKLAILGGLMLDFFSFVPIGAEVLSFLLAAIGVDYLAKRFLVTPKTWRFFILIALIAAGTIINEIFLLLIMKIYLAIHQTAGGAPPLFNGAFAYKIIYNIVIFALLYWPLEKSEIIFNFYGSRSELKTNAG